MEIRQGTAVLWRGPGVVQVGSDPDHHFVLDGLSPAEQTWILSAARSHPDLGPPPGRTASPRSPQASRWEAPTPAAARVAARMRLDPSGTGPAPRTHGSRPSVRIDGIDAITTAAARLLARSGVSRMDVVDPRHVDDALLSTFAVDDLGAPRVQALAGDLERLGRVRVAPLGVPDVVVLSRLRVPDWGTASMLGVENRVHLLVTHHETAVEVGPLVVPGRTACSQCRALHLTDADPHWPMTAREIPAWPVPPPDAALETVAALEIARAVLGITGHSDLGPTPLVGTGSDIVLRVEAGGRMRRVANPPHPRCPCGAADQAVSTGASTSSPRTRARTTTP